MRKKDPWQDGEYFSSYDALKLHLEMLSDRPRTLAYRNAIEGAKNFIEGKVVLDFGCGTGILSLFLARLGRAAKVFAVDASDIAEQARELVEQNGLSEKVEVIQCKGEELELPEKVDLIVSEWMGTLLLFELMLESVLIARNKWLKEDGVMWPSTAKLFLAPCSASKLHKEKVDFWDDVYGFDFSPLKPLAQEELFGGPVYNHVMEKGDSLADAATILHLTLKTTSLDDLESNEGEFSFDIMEAGTLHGFASWFEVTFDDIPCSETTPITLSTSPDKPLTHWKQDLLMMDEPISVEPGDVLNGRISIVRNRHWRRHLHVSISYTHRNKEGEESKEYCKDFKLWR